MKRLLAVLSVGFFLQPSLHAADKIRIGFPDFAAQFGSLPLAQKKAFSKNKTFRLKSSA